MTTIGWIVLGIGVLVLVLGVAWVMARMYRPPDATRLTPPSPPALSAPPEGSRSAEVKALLGELKPGAVVGGYEIVQIYEDYRGGIPVVLAKPGGEQYRVDILRRSEDDPSPPAQTEHLSLYVSCVRPNSRTPEDAMVAARELAAELSKHQTAPPPWLATMRGRRDTRRS